MEVAARGSGFGRKRRREIVLATVASYRNAMRTFAGLGNLDVWFTQTDVDQLRSAMRASSPRSTASAWPRDWPRRRSATACRNWAS